MKRREAIISILLSEVYNAVIDELNAYQTDTEQNKFTEDPLRDLSHDLFADKRAGNRDKKKEGNIYNEFFREETAADIDRYPRNINGQ